MVTSRRRGIETYGIAFISVSVLVLPRILGLSTEYSVKKKQRKKEMNTAKGLGQAEIQWSEKREKKKT